MNNQADHNAPKGLVLHARILWTFSAAFRLFQEERCLELADMAFSYLYSGFLDADHGGYYWLLDASGRPVQTKKQIYAQAFVIYAFAEYYLARENQEALGLAKDLFHLIEEFSFDPVQNGYFEAFSSDWGPLEDLRLSELDMNEKKTMNTHLHILEGYTNLYRVWPDSRLKDKIKNLLEVFYGHIIDPVDFHFRLFFDETWNSKSDTISYGHDIEGSWLIQEAAEVLGESKLIADAKENAVRMARAVLPGINDFGGLCHETEREHPSNVGEMEWWAQAEGVVGFLNAWENSGEGRFLRTALKLSDFILSYFIDIHGGEWYYRLTPEGEPIESYDKVGLWKCPYHNGRMCFELIRRINSLLG